MTSTVTLPELINNCTLNVNDLRKLPKPEPLKMNHLGLKYEVSQDLAHWRSVPADVKEDEVKRTHAFLFENTAELSKFTGSKEPFMPYPFD